MIILALLIGVIAGLRALTPLAAISLAAKFGILDFGGTWLAFMGYRWSPWLFCALAVAELVNDKLPTTPSRKVPAQFGTRILTGTFAGLAIGTPTDMGVVCGLCGAIGAVVGTLAGASARAKLVQLIGGKDLPVALLEDCIAIGTAGWIVASIAV